MTVSWWKRETWMEILKHLRAWCVVSGPSAYHCLTPAERMGRSAETMEPEITRFCPSKLLRWWHLFIYLFYISVLTNLYTDWNARYFCLLVCFQILLNPNMPNLAKGYALETRSAVPGDHQTLDFISRHVLQTCQGPHSAELRFLRPHTHIQALVPETTYSHTNSSFLRPHTHIQTLAQMPSYSSYFAWIFSILMCCVTVV